VPLAASLLRALALTLLTVLLTSLMVSAPAARSLAGTIDPGAEGAPTAEGAVEGDATDPALEALEEPVEPEPEAADAIAPVATPTPSPAPLEAPAESTFEPAVEAAVAGLSVSMTEGLDPEGQELTVSGSGYEIDAGGIYAQIGWIIEGEWTPVSSEETRSGNRASAYSAWVGSGFPGQPAWTVAEDGSGSFSWTVEVTREALEAKRLEGGTLAVFTLGSHGNWVQPANERFVPIAFAAPVPTVTLSQSEGLEPGNTITVTGENFGPVEGETTASRPPLAGKFGGVYVAFGSFAEVWRPSDSAPRGSRVTAPDQVVWAVAEEDEAMIAGFGRAAAIDPEGSFELELTVTDEWEGMLEEGTLGVYTYPGGGVTYAPFETVTPVTFAAVTPDPEPGPGTQPPQTPSPSAAGTLRWGVKESFRSYVTGPVAQGSISVSGAGSSGGAVVFPQTSAATGSATGTVSYGGTVRYRGHGGALDVSLSSPAVRFTSASTAALTVAANGSRLTIATLALGSGARNTLPDGSIRFAGVPATLTAAGSTVFSFQGSTFYPAGTALDPVTFTIGAAASGGTGGSSTVASYTAPVIPSTPPATEGATLVGGDPRSVVVGDEITVTASGFGSGEQGIQVVVYSEPQMLAESLTADPDGTVSWTGTLPEELVGEHTLTFQGSIDRGIVLTIAEPIASVSVADSCLVEDARLEWGFKESFRAYVSGSIANGEWQVADGASYETPVFTFGGGTGAIAPDWAKGELFFDGSIRFTGHGGILDTTVANPRVIMTSAEAGQLVLDVVGTTQEGEEVSAEGVVFADLDLTAASRSTEGGELTIEGIAATLTASGAEAFGTYPAGDPLDPVSLVVTFGEDCGALTNDDELATDALASGDSGAPWWWSVLAIVVIALIAVAAAVVIVRRRGA